MSEDKSATRLNDREREDIDFSPEKTGAEKIQEIEPMAAGSDGGEKAADNAELKDSLKQETDESLKRETGKNNPEEGSTGEDGATSASKVEEESRTEMEESEAETSPTSELEDGSGTELAESEAETGPTSDLEHCSQTNLDGDLNAEPVISDNSEEVKKEEPPSAIEPESNSGLPEVATADGESLAAGSETTESAGQPTESEVAPSQPSKNEPTDLEAGAFNFTADEVKNYFVPVPPVKRLCAATIALFCFAALGYFACQAPIVAPIGGVHTIEIPEPGTYIVFFRGKIEDPYGWVKDGRFRRSLTMELQKIYEEEGLTRITPFKDLSGPNNFSVAEYDINASGKYLCWSEWKEPSDTCPGQLYFEKDPVEKFFGKWVLGIIGTIALFLSLGIPMSSREAQSTLVKETK